MDSQYKKCFVLGSSSFGGAWFVDRALEQGMEVFGIGRSSSVHDIFLPYKTNKNLQLFSYRQMDINHKSEELIATIEKIKPEVIVDFAGQSMVTESWNWPEQWYQTNIIAKAKILKELIKMPFFKRYIRVSSPVVYGNIEGFLVEDTPYNPSTPYAVSQAAIDMHLMAYFNQFEFPVIIARFPNFYGSGQQLYRIVPRAMICALSEEFFPLHGGGSSVRAFIHGRDISDGILKAMDKGKPGQIYHFSTDEFVTIRELMEKISKKCRIKLEDFIKIVPKHQDNDSAYLMNANKAKTELGWKPQYNLDSGLEETFKWIRDNFDIIRKMPKHYRHIK